MKPARFAYHAPTNLEAALELLHTHGKTSLLLAGGQSLMPLLNRRQLKPDVLIDINGLTSLDRIEASNGSLHVGAMVRFRTLERHTRLRHDCPLLALALPWIGNPAVRNRGTLGGSLAHADPVAELPACLVNLEARIVLASVRGTRSLPAQAFFLGRGRTSRQADELILGADIPLATAHDRYGFIEQGRRGRDAAIAGVAWSKRASDTHPVVTLFGATDTLRTLAISPQLPWQDTRAMAQWLHTQLHPYGDAGWPAATRMRIAAALLKRTLSEMPHGNR